MNDSDDPPPGADPVRLLVADDHPVYRAGLAALLERDPAIELVGQAADGTEAVEMAAALMPDVILMDVSMPGMGGIEATRVITTASPHVTVLMLTMVRDDNSLFAALRAGARGYLLKEADSTEVSRAVLAAASGEAVFGGAIAARLLTFFAEADSYGPALFPALSDREREILDLVARGHNNAKIAAELWLSQKTVRNHVYNIVTKLQVADRAEAIIRARDAGLGASPDR